MNGKKMLQLSSVLFNNIDLDAISPEIAQAIIEDPQQAGAQFTLFLQNGARVMIGEPTTLLCSTPFDPVTFFNEPKWKKETKDEDKRGTALKQLDLTTILFETCLKAGESRITGEEKLTLLKTSGKVRLGSNAFLALWQDYKARGANSALEWLRRNRGITYLDFFGEVLVRPSGCRYVPYLYFDGGGWYWSYRSLGRVWLANFVSAVVASESLDQ